MADLDFERLTGILSQLKKAKLEQRLTPDLFMRLRRQAISAVGDTRFIESVELYRPAELTNVRL